MTDGADELYSMLVPLSGSRLLVPRVCVAEVSGLGQLRLDEDRPEWLVGQVGWQGREVPLLCFEAACGAEIPEIGSRTRAVIFHCTGPLEGGFLAIMSQGLPQLLRLSSEVLAPDEETPWPDDAPVICRVRMINEYPLVPDLEELERRLAALRPA